jgi:hypothetical protein
MTDEQVFAVKDPSLHGYDSAVPDRTENDRTEDDPDAPVVRYRCTACGNLTRFDVTTTRRSRAFHHYSVGGELQVEDVVVLDEDVESVVCHWCGTGDAVVELDAADAAELAAGDG